MIHNNTKKKFNIIQYTPIISDLYMFPYINIAEALVN